MRVERKVVLDIDYCIDCKSCSAACTYTHPDWASTISTGSIAEDASFPFICRHCEEPACKAACPQDAIRRDENGVIRRLSMLCIGCKSCSLACPFGVIEPELKAHIISKCDLCLERLEKGEEPACVSSCPAGALKFVEVSESVKEGQFILVGARTAAHIPWRRRAR
ncbi:TPA: 4Fe-4S dicluster domain-containing protein [Candidatus Poribacteria bacterium]|nr:4Fe-4S dicluster domain-containing protein [Candidatus Poribacteria bacterium]